MQKHGFYLLLIVFISILVTVNGCLDREGRSPVSHDVRPETKVIRISTVIREQPSSNAKTVLTLEKGNLVKVLEKKVVGNEEWSYVECVPLSYPPMKGWLKINDYSADMKNITPNQGFIRGKNIYSSPDSESKIIWSDAHSVLSIIRRENGWAYCRLPAGMENGWIKESDISYEFPVP
ncbi:MAG: hypothetical protein QJR05_10465 [Thermoanaerobacterium sp.]|nr:hypothetical protein [Thermoanaerobacterium sp.]